MNETLVENRLRRYLLLLSISIFPMTVIELWLTEHTEATNQLIPFFVSGLGFLAIIAVFLRPNRRTLIALRIIMGIVIFSSVLGIYFHLTGNFEFELEIRPNAVASEVIMDALKGANPLLAPGILALAGFLGIAATYQHPKLDETTHP